MVVEKGVLENNCESKQIIECWSSICACIGGKQFVDRANDKNKPFST
jgi:hypothetical protein